MIEIKDNLYILNTLHTSYAFRVMETGQLEHLYYGKRVHINSCDTLIEKNKFAPPNTCVYTNENTDFSLENISLETSAYGKGDIREPMVEVICKDGSSTLDFVFESAELTRGKDKISLLPSSYDENNETDHLVIRLRDKNEGFLLELHYYVFEDDDVITRRSIFINSSRDSVELTRLLSYQIDMAKVGYTVTTFNGSWANEMNKNDTVISSGKLINSSFTGNSSNRSNPFFMLSEPNTTEKSGACYGFNLVYSGNHYSAIEVGSYNTTRICGGINPRGFKFTLAPNEQLESPEAVISFSDSGFTTLSHNFHSFVREHIVRGEWKYRERPILINSWEASYFDIDEEKLLELGKKAGSVGIELLVMDDGWFGNRNSDKSSLGDWVANKSKLPSGVKGLADKINLLGLDFGIWVEPEMINEDSELYRSHPDWAIAIPNKNHSEGRFQRILDFCNPKVVSYIIEKMTELLSSANISYVKWDMNRNFSDYYSPYLKPERQGECAHRYIMGLYKVMETLTRSFPHILFEGCASGGNRFDLGTLCYFPQIWASDNTDALCRLNIQNGYSYAYPLSTYTNHVSVCPNHQTGRTIPLSTRFTVATFGLLGYECNLCEMTDKELEKIREQVVLYKKIRKALQFGDFYRDRVNEEYSWAITSKDGSLSLGMLMELISKPNKADRIYYAKGLVEDRLYNFAELGTDENNYTAYGDSLMYCGVRPREVEITSEERYSDFTSHLYFMWQNSIED